MKRAPFVLALALLGSGCFRFEMSWERIDSAPFVDPQGGYRVELPVGWARLGGLLSRDGFALQTISYGEGDFSEALREAQMDPSQPDLATMVEFMLQQLLASSRDVTLLESIPTTIAGCQAVRLHTREEPRGGAFAIFEALPAHTQRERLTYVAVHDDRLYFFTYEAPALHYFERDLPTFERLVQSFEPLEPEGHSGP